MNSVLPNEPLAGDDCGRFGALTFDGRNLCPACYAAGGACCPEFGREEDDRTAN